MSVPPIDAALADRLYERASAERWALERARWTEALQASAERAFADRVPTRSELDRYLGALHLEDLALACACAAGHEPAWDHFMREQRPILYRSARAIDPGDPTSSRELADLLYADLYGISDRGGARRSLLRHFHGRSSLATWLRAVLAQRHVDRLRADRRIEPLPDDESPAAIASPVAEPADPERPRYLALIERALARAIEGLDSRDRLRLGCYYAQGMTLARIGQLLGEHEATVSRHLSRTRRALREHIERQLRRDGLADAEMSACFECVLDDTGPIDLSRMLATGGDTGKELKPDRSVRRGTL